MAEKQFVDGLRVKERSDRTPDWIKMQLAINREQLIAWLQNRTEQWIDIDIKESKAGKMYCEVNTWKPENSNQTESNIDDSYTEIPF